MEIIAVSGVISNVGTSTVAANIATLMSSESNSTLLIDCSCNNNGVLAALGLEEQSKYDIYADIFNWDKGELLMSSKGVYVLQGSERIEQVTASMINDILNTFSGKHDYIVLDVGVLKSSIADVLSFAHKVILVAEPNYKCITNNNVPVDDYILIVNKVSPKNNMYHPRDIIRRFNAKLNFEIAEDIKAAKKSVQKQRPMIDCSKKINKQFTDIVSKLLFVDINNKKKSILRFLNFRKQGYKEVHTAENYQSRITPEEVDYLTGCLTRSSIDEIVYKPNGTYAVLFIDLDNFKPINDTFGHTAGDAVLQEFSQYIFSTIRPGIDKVVRYGGDEFVVILDSVDINKAKDVAKAILNFDTVYFNNNEMKISASIGIAQSCRGSKLEDVIQEADKAMYRAKTAGKKQFAVAINENTNIKTKQPINDNSNLDIKELLAKDNPVFIKPGNSTIVEFIKKARQPLVVIDAEDGRLATILGIDPNSSWKFDWRIGLAATPAKIGKKTEIYSIPIEREEMDFEERDFRALKDIINQSLRAKKKVIIITENLYSKIKDIVCGVGV